MLGCLLWPLMLLLPSISRAYVVYPALLMPRENFASDQKHLWSSQNSVQVGITENNFFIITLLSYVMTM